MSEVLNHEACGPHRNDLMISYFEETETKRCKILLRQNIT